MSVETGNRPVRTKGGTREVRCSMAMGPGRMGLGISIFFHAVAVFLVVTASARTGAVPPRPVTVFLEGEPFFAQHETSEKKGQTAHARPAGPTGVPARIERKSVSAAQSRPDTGGLREAARETGAETEGAVSSGFSEVVSDTPPMVHGGGESGTGTAGIEGRGPGGSDATRGGSGATKMAGAAGTETGPGEGLAGAGEIAKKTYVKEHFAFIRDLILKNLVYPAIARRMGWRGDLTVSFVICESGTVDDIRILKSSGHKVLDETAVATIRGIAPFPRPPVRAEIIIPIEYRIG